eukprot:5758433-Amphidinium_carterae.1
MDRIRMAFGHGLRGPLPRIPGTVALLSLWGNGLKGPFPETHITGQSTLFAHTNDFSCKLPLNAGVEAGTGVASLVLAGNHFAQPQRPPSWITRLEQPSDMFCVSNERGKHFAMLLILACCIFISVAFKTLRDLKGRAMHGKFARARSAWHEASQYQRQFLVASCGLLILHSNMVSRACTVVSDHLRLHFLTALTCRPTEGVAVLVLHMYMCESGKRFHARHQARSPDPCHAKSVQAKAPFVY